MSEVVFRLEVRCEGAAFDYPEVELARILRALAERTVEMDVGDYSRGVMDVNGNRCGKWSLLEEVTS